MGPRPDNGTQSPLASVSAADAPAPPAPPAPRGDLPPLLPTPLPGQRGKSAPSLSGSRHESADEGQDGGRRRRVSRRGAGPSPRSGATEPPGDPRHRPESPPEWPLDHVVCVCFLCGTTARYPWASMPTALRLSWRRLDADGGPRGRGGAPGPEAARALPPGPAEPSPALHCHLICARDMDDAELMRRGAAGRPPPPPGGVPPSPPASGSTGGVDGGAGGGPGGGRSGGAASGRWTVPSPRGGSPPGASPRDGVSAVHAARSVRSAVSSPPSPSLPLAPAPAADSNPKPSRRNLFAPSSSAVPSAAASVRSSDDAAASISPDDVAVGASTAPTSMAGRSGGRPRDTAGGPGAPPPPPAPPDAPLSLDVLTSTSKSVSGDREGGGSGGAGAGAGAGVPPGGGFERGRPLGRLSNPHRPRGRSDGGGGREKVGSLDLSALLGDGGALLGAPDDLGPSPHLRASGGPGVAGARLPRGSSPPPVRAGGALLTGLVEGGSGGEEGEEGETVEGLSGRM